MSSRPNWASTSGEVSVLCTRLLERDDLWKGLPNHFARAYPRRVRPDLLSVEELAERLACAPDEAVALLRRVGPRGVVRTNDRRFLVPAEAVDELRAAVAAETA